MIEVSILLTCYNRKKKTLEALSTLFEALDYYNEGCDNQISYSVFLTDDGCTDGTSEAVLTSFAAKVINIIRSDGNAFWAGGMRLAWRNAIETNSKSDFFILINDDTCFKRECIIDLFKTHKYALDKYGIGGIYTGFVSEFNNENKILYGAKRYDNGFFSKAISMIPTGNPQECELVNANILMVSANVVQKIGILDEAFIHAAADLDYGIRSKNAGFPVLTTSGVCGYGEFDHDNSDVECEKVMKMTLEERRDFLQFPTVKQYHDSLVFFRRYDKIKWVICGVSYYLNLYFPYVYYKWYKKRGH